jgi:hypothetical protein
MAKKNEEREERMGERTTEQEPGGESGDIRIREEASPAKAGRQSAAPLCPIHNVRCTAGSSTAVFTRYYCPEKDCDFSVKQQRPRASMKPEPTEDFSAR